MKALLILIAACFSAAAFAQSPLPKAQLKLQTPTGCKLVGTVKGTKIWAGDCADAAGLRGAVPGEDAPLSPPEPAGSPIPPEQKQ